MSKRLRGLAAVVGLLLCADARPDAAGAGAISGVALDTASGRPLVGAIVQLTGPTLETPRTVLSEDGGKFTLADLPAGSYALSVKLDGYQPFQRAEVAVKEGETARVGAWLAPEGTEGEEVVVTGSRIRRKDLTTPAPVTIIDREQIERSGLIGLGEFLQRLPEQGGAVNAQMNNGNQGQVEFGLRSLGSRRTLVLVNGRRWVGHNGETMVDLNTIPLAAVERVEVMKDGASPVYGSDAIAGVVNVILKQKFEGTQVSAQGGVSSRGDAGSYDLSGSTGFTGKRGSVFLSLGYQEQRPSMATSRRWSAHEQTYDFATHTTQNSTSSYTPGGTIELTDAATVCAADPGSMSAALRQACQRYADTGNAYSVYDKRLGAYRGMEDGDLYNYQRDSYLLTPARRFQVFTTGNLQLSEEVRGFYEASFTNRQSSRRFPGSPEWLPVSSQSLYNDFGVDVVARKRMVEAGVRRYTEDVNTYRLAVGLDGEAGAWAGPLRGWGWNVAYVYGRSMLDDRSHGILREDQLQASVGPSALVGGVPTCTGADAPAGCVPFDAMHGEGAFTPEQRQALTYTGKGHGEQEQQVLTLGASGKLLELWANRPVAMAAGMDLRRESGGYRQDPITAAGLGSDGGQPPVSGGYSTRELYAELSVPLVSQRPLVEDLELVAALRNVDYSSFGNNTTYKVGGRWMPVRDVTLRGTWSTAFRAPGILELYTGNASSVEAADDPCVSPATPAVAQRCHDELGANLPTPDGNREVPVLMGGNTHLRPETAKVFTGGLVLQPRWVRGLSLTVDYWDIELEHAVETLGAQNILTRCYAGDASGELCRSVHRDPTSGRITRVDDNYLNVGRTRAAGVDAAARSTVPTRAAGAFSFGLDVTYLLRFDQTQLDGTVDHAAGTYDLKQLLARWKWNADVGWQYGPFGVTTGARYIGALKECAGGSCETYPDQSRQVSPNLVFDLAASWTSRNALGTTGVLVGVRNVFDSAPPRIFTADYTSTDPTYDFTGRYVWARVTQAF